MGTINCADEHFVIQVSHNSNSSLSKGKIGDKRGWLIIKADTLLQATQRRNATRPNTRTEMAVLRVVDIVITRLVAAHSNVNKFALFRSDSGPRS